MNSDVMSFSISENWSVINLSVIESDMVQQIIYQLKEVYTDYNNFLQNISHQLLVFNKLDNHEFLWLVNLDNQKINFVQFDLTIEINDFSEKFNELQMISIEDFSRISIREYSHDLSNLVTIVLINIGYLKGEIEEGSVKTNNDDMVNQILGSSLETTEKLKDLIAKVRSENQWNTDMVEGTSILQNVLKYVFLMTKHNFKENSIFITNLYRAEQIAIKEIRMIQLLQLALLNSINAVNQNFIKYIILKAIIADDKYNIIIKDNSNEMKMNNMRKIHRQYDHKASYTIHSGLNNIKKILVLLSGELRLDNPNQLSLSIPK